MRNDKKYGTASRMGIRNCILLGWMLVMMAIMLMGGDVEAATIDFKAKVTELQTKFPHGKYWNKVGMTTDNSDGYTEKACTLHKTTGVDCVYNTGGCTCNHFTGGGGHLMATQCMGFANKLAYDVFGETTWTQITSPTATQIADIRVGDIVRLNYNGHSVFVIARAGNNIMVGEANYDGYCQISWGRIIDLSTANITYYERAANYETVLGNQSSDVTEGGDSTTESTESTGGATTEQDSTETTTEVATDFTGWKKATDGVHYQYYKSGKLQKKKWLTIKKKKYYVDKNGYRVTGFYDVKKQTYYFNSKGVMQKNKWFAMNGETYHVNKSGLVLKSQWLYYKGKLVYVTKDGSIAKSEIVKIGSKQYYFNASGKRSKGFKKYKGKYYYTNSSGVIQKKKWITKGEKKYYLQKSGVRAQSKLIKIGKYRYYFDKKGQMVKNKKVTYKDKIYKADKKGRCKFVENVPATEETTSEQTTETSTEQITESTEQATENTEQNTETTTESGAEHTAGDMNYVTDLTQ